MRMPSPRTAPVRHLTFYKEDVVRLERLLDDLRRDASALGAAFVSDDVRWVARSGDLAPFTREDADAFLAGALTSKAAFVLAQKERESISLIRQPNYGWFVVVYDDRSTAGRVQLYVDLKGGKVAAFLDEIDSRKEAAAALSKEFRDPPAGGPPMPPLAPA